jgi:hypothetical protein
METRRRRRPALSCIECRSRKVRCDRSHPCRPCTVHRVACNYRDLAPNIVPNAKEVSSSRKSQSDGDNTPMSATSAMLGISLTSPQSNVAAETAETVSIRRTPSEQRNVAADAHDSYTHTGRIATSPALDDVRRPMGLKKTRLLKVSDTIGVLFGKASEVSHAASSGPRSSHL